MRYEDFETFFQQNLQNENVDEHGNTNVDMDQSVGHNLNTIPSNKNAVDVFEDNTNFDSVEVSSIEVERVKFVPITKDMIKAARGYTKPDHRPIPARRDIKNLFAKDYSNLTALAIYDEKPSVRDFLGLWKIPSNDKDFPYRAVIHYGHAFLQKQPSFYQNPFSSQIWNITGVDDEHHNLLYSDMKLKDLFHGIGVEKVCYSEEETNIFER